MVRVPLAIRRRPGRKTVVTPVSEGGEATLRTPRGHRRGPSAAESQPAPVPPGRTGRFAVGLREPGGDGGLALGADAAEVRRRWRR